MAETALARYVKKLHNAAAMLYREAPTDRATGMTHYMTDQANSVLRIGELQEIKAFLKTHNGLPAWAKASVQKAGPLSKGRFPAAFMERLAHVANSVGVIAQTMKTFQAAETETRQRLLIQEWVVCQE